MSENIVEYIRKESINNLFKTNTFKNSWINWKQIISFDFTPNSSRQIIDLGDKLSAIFTTTSPSVRDNSSVSGGGAAWESLVCWYLNLCLIGRRTVVIKHSKKLIPDPISDAITVKYNTFPSNTESDLIAITFPNKCEYIDDKDLINIRDSTGTVILLKKGKKFNYKEVINALSSRDFSDLEIHIIQCKTNWNDNAQIPMLWDMVYSAKTFKNNNITVGQNGYSISNVNRFTYSFVTVPTIATDVKAKLNTNSTCVRRVFYLSGGNYWGLPTKSGVANSLKEMLQRNLNAGYKTNHLTSLKNELPKLKTTYSYFDI